MPYRKPDDPQNHRASPYLLALLVVLLIAGVGIGSFLYARRDSMASRARADRRGAALASVQEQLRSAAKQNDYLAEQVRQGTQALTSAGNDSQGTEQKLRAALRSARGAQAKAMAKLHGLSSGLSESIGAVHYAPPAGHGSAGSIDGSLTITNAAGVPLKPVCIVTVSGTSFAVTSHAVPAGSSVLEAFHFPFAGSKPSGVSSGGCGRL
jgi:type II secretory pathway pseudopilin PulG